MHIGQARLARPGLTANQRPFLGMLAVAFGTLVVPFDSAVNVAFPDITRAFGLPIPAIQWVVIAYTLTYAALMLVFGRIGDMFGYRRIFLIGCAWSTIGFVACAAAPSFLWLLVARVMQGVGAALALSCGPAIATSLYAEAERTRILGVYTMIFGIGGALGPVLAGELVQHWHWQAVFWFRAPISLVGFVLALGLPPGEHDGRSRFDAAGAALLVATITSFLLALNQLQHMESIRPFGLLAALTVAGCTGFVVRERRAAHPIIHLHHFHDWDFALVNAAHVVLNVAGFSIMLLVPFYLDRVAKLSVPMVGLALAAMPVGVIVAGPAAGLAANWITPHRLALTGTGLAALTQILLGLFGAHPQIIALAAAMALQGFALGLFQVAYLDIATATIPREDRGVAGSLVMVTRTVGVVTGATVLMLLFQTLRSSAPGVGSTEADVFLHAFQGVFRIAATLPILAFIAELVCGWARPGHAGEAG